MKFIGFALLLLMSPASGRSQPVFAGSSFGSSSSSRFGAGGPGFPDTSAKSLNPAPELVTPAIVPLSLSYAYPVGPRRLTAPQTLGGRMLMLVFRDQTVEAAAGYRIEGSLLHYVTPFGLARTVPVKRVDWKLTGQTSSVPAYCCCCCCCWGGSSSAGVSTGPAAVSCRYSWPSLSRAGRTRTSTDSR
jgi:hypothetical protein